MKHSYSFILQIVRAKFGLSCRATDYVHETYMETPLRRGANEHLSRNGGVPSEKALAALAFLHALPVEDSHAYEAFLQDQQELREQQNKHTEQWGNEIAVFGLCDKAARSAVLEKLSQEADEWWQREGKFEEEIEERGESKYYHHAKDCAAREGRDIEAREYLASL